jgi:hypothetical protein
MASTARGTGLARDERGDMSDWRQAKADLWATLRGGEWWWYAGAFYAHHQLPTLKAFYGNSGGTQTVALISELGGAAQSLGEITFVGSDNETHVYVTFAESEEAPRFWQNAIRALREMSAHARLFRQEAGKMAADDVIETYYRRRARGTRVTLKQLAEEYGFNVNYLRTVKTAYDKAGRWGSKKAR